MVRVSNYRPVGSSSIQKLFLSIQYELYKCSLLLSTVNDVMWSLWCHGSHIGTQTLGSCISLPYPALPLTWESLWNHDSISYKLWHFWNGPVITGKFCFKSTNYWCTSYTIVTMLDDFDKGFFLFAIQMSSNMTKISLSFKSLGIGCTPPINRQ